MAHKRPSMEKLYAAIEPIPAMRAAAGMAADGASPKAAIPVYCLNHMCNYINVSVFNIEEDTIQPNYYTPQKEK